MSAVTPEPGITGAVATYDNRPYFARALDHGLRNGIIDTEKLEAMRSDGAKGIVQIANFFGTAHLRNDLDDAMKRMVNLASLYLEHKSDGNLTRAARSLQDNTFLSHSRGGSEMLKALYAMPTDSILHDPLDGDGVKEFLRARTLADPWSVSVYRAALAERSAFQAEIDAALWFADVMEMPRESLSGESAEAILHACLLTRVAGRMEGGLLEAAELKAFLKSFRASRKKNPVPPNLLDDVADEHRATIERHFERLTTRDLPRIRDKKVAFNDLVREYHDLFHPFSQLLEDVSEFDVMVTDAWRRVTQGMTDTDSMNTIFLCLAAGRPPKPAITAAEAKTIIQSIRANGADGKNVREFVLTSAPHQMIDGLLSLWEDEFEPEVVDELIIQGDEGSLEPLVRLLAEHCHIKSAARKA